MTTPTATPPTNALQVHEAAGLEFNLDNWPSDRFNRLIPTQTIRMPSDLVVPVIQVVQLDTGRDTYESPDVPKGSRAINRIGLRKLATAAGVSIIDERRTDDGSDPNVCEVTCMAEMVLPTGQRVRAPGMKRVDLGRQKWASDNQRAKYASFFQEHVASRAENRAVRALLSLQASYPLAELARPFAVVTYAPNMNHPEVRARMLDAMAPAVSALYGPDQAKQLAAGQQITVVPEAPDDAEPAVRDLADGRAVEVATGEVKEEPDWFGAGAPVTLRDRLVAAAEKSELKGPASAEQRDGLREALAGSGTPSVQAVTAALWDFTNLPEITAAQAQAILEVAAALGLEAFRAEWLALAAEVAG